MGENKNEGASVFKEKTGDDGNKDEYFNRGSEDGADHGHRVTDSEGKEEYVRDNEGTEYDV